jgi:hypothetical protein
MAVVVVEWLELINIDEYQSQGGFSLRALLSSIVIALSKPRRFTSPVSASRRAMRFITEHTHRLLIINNENIHKDNGPG